MSNNLHDDVYMEILKEEKDVVSFLDSVFGFLYRCTDFYHLNDEAARRIGFPSGVAKSLVEKTFERYERQTKYDGQAAVLNKMSTVNPDVPAASEEVEVAAVKEPIPSKPSLVRQTDNSESYNGDDRGNYRWSQSMKDIDVRMNVNSNIVKSKQLRVDVKAHNLKIEVAENGEWTAILDGSFPHKINKSDCIWSLVPGDHVHVNLEKSDERWWDRLFTCDPAINTRKIDTTDRAYNMSQAEHMKIEELVEKRLQNSNSMT